MGEAVIADCRLGISDFGSDWLSDAKWEEDG